MFAFCVFLRAQFTWVHFSTFTEHFLRSKSYISNPISTLLLLLLLLLSHFSHVGLCACGTLLWLHRRQPTRLPRPWDSPGKNTGVGCRFLLQCMQGKVKVKSLSRGRLLATPWTAAYQAPLSMGFTRPEDWSGCHCLLRHCLLIVP